ncbi:MAG: hypothetical protein SFZ23_01890 [Planctomycetota bacterium]|nr:hypothetical protein [Planctomycetota bacterium]
MTTTMTPTTTTTTTSTESPIFASLRQRWDRLPRATRWLTAFLLFVALYFALVEPAIDARQRWSTRADSIEARLASLSTSDGVPSEVRSDLAAGVRRFGEPPLPGDPRAASESLTRRITSVLLEHDVREHTATSREVPVASGPLVSSLGTEARLKRLIREIQFVATPEAVASIIAALERSPDVASVSRVQLRKQGGARSEGDVVRAVVAVEAWAASRQGGRR